MHKHNNLFEGTVKKKKKKIATAARICESDISEKGSSLR